MCQHGSTCLFRNAPRDLCLAYLLGLCHGCDGVDNDNNNNNNNRENENNSMYNYNESSKIIANTRNNNVKNTAS